MPLSRENEKFLQDIFMTSEDGKRAYETEESSATYARFVMI